MEVRGHLEPVGPMTQAPRARQQARAAVLSRRISKPLAGYGEVSRQSQSESGDSLEGTAGGFGIDGENRVDPLREVLGTGTPDADGEMHWRGRSKFRVQGNITFEQPVTGHAGASRQRLRRDDDVPAVRRSLQGFAPGFESSLSVMNFLTTPDDGDDCRP